MKRILLSLWMITLATLANAQKQDSVNVTPITSLSQVANVAAADLMIVLPSGDTTFKRVTAEQLKDYITPIPLPGVGGTDGFCLKYNESMNMFIYGECGGVTSAAEVAYTSNGVSNVEEGLDSLFSVQKVIGAQVFGDSIFQLSKVVEVSRYNDLRNEFGGVAMNPYTGRIVVVYMYSSSHNHVPATEITVAQYSDDMGQTWSDTIHVFNQPAAPDQSIGAAATIMWDWLENKFIVQARNRQTGQPGYMTLIDTWDGVNWTNQRDFNPSTFDGEGFSFFASPTPPVRLRSDSSLLLTAYFAQPSSLDTGLVAVWKQPYNGSIDSGTLIHKGDANNASWATEAQIREKKDSTLVVFIRGRDNDLTGSNFTWMSYDSYDYGATWTNFQDRSPNDFNQTKPSWDYFGSNDDYIFAMYRSASDGNRGLYSYSETGLIGEWSEPKYLPKFVNADTLKKTGYFLPGDIHKINDNTALIQYTATDSVGVLQTIGLKVRCFFQVLTFKNPPEEIPNDEVGIDGSGTTNTIPVFSSATNLADSKISQTASKVIMTIPEEVQGAGVEVSNLDGGVEFQNSTSASGSFAPSLTFTAKNRRPTSFNLTDNLGGGSFPMLDIRGNILGGNVSTRNLVAISNNNTQLFRFSPNGQLSINSPTTAHRAHLDVVGTSTQLRLTNIMDSLYVNFTVDNTGKLTVTPVDSLTDITGVLSASTGFRVNNGALTGEYLRGDGTNFVSSTIQESDLPTRPGTDVTLTDSGTYFTTDNAEAALQELGEKTTVLTGSGAPVTTPDFVGQIYIDTGGPTVYIATGTSGSGDWTALN